MKSEKMNPFEKQAKTDARPHLRNDVRHLAIVMKFVMPALILMCAIQLIIGIYVHLIISVIFIVFLLLLAYFGRRSFEIRIFKPLENLKDAIDEVSKGNLNVEVPVEVMNDVGMLTTTFNDMITQLRENEAQKKEYEENRKQLIANISHDLKTPITSIQGYIEIIKTMELEEDKKEQYLDIIGKNANYMNLLIEDLFLMSKLDMHKLKFDFENICINRFMEDLAEEYYFDFSEKNLKFSFVDCMQEQQLVRIDGKRLSQAIRNIVTNSIKHGANDALEVKISLAEDDLNIYLCINDNGVGIIPEHIDKIFDRFYSVDEPRTKKLENSGLGLPIAKELIEAMGGQIKVSSELNEGTTFEISLRKVQA